MGIFAQGAGWPERSEPTNTFALSRAWGAGNALQRRSVGLHRSINAARSACPAPDLRRLERRIHPCRGTCSCNNSTTIRLSRRSRPARGDKPSFASASSAFKFGSDRELYQRFAVKPAGAVRPSSMSGTSHFRRRNEGAPARRHAIGQSQGSCKCSCCSARRTAGLARMRFMYGPTWGQLAPGRGIPRDHRHRVSAQASTAE